MKRKRDIVTRKFYKWKARLNFHGGQQEYRVIWLDNYSLVGHLVLYQNPTESIRYQQVAFNTGRLRSGLPTISHWVWTLHGITKGLQDQSRSRVHRSSQSLYDAIPMMQLLREMKGNGFPTLSTTPEVHCRAFEDNSCALELARTPKMRPRTNQVYHHFRDFVWNGTIRIFTIEIVSGRHG